MENIIKRLDISVQQEATNEYLRLQKKIQSILDEGTPLNIAKTKELIEGAKKEYESSPTTKSYVHFHFYKNLLNKYYKGEIITKQQGNLFADNETTIQELYFSNLQKNEYQEGKFKYIAVQKNYIDPKTYNVLKRYAELHHGQVHKGKPTGFVFFIEQDAINFLNIKTDGQYQQLQNNPSERANRATEEPVNLDGNTIRTQNDDGRASNGKQYSDSSERSRNNSYQEGVTGHGLHNRGDRTKNSTESTRDNGTKGKRSSAILDEKITNAATKKANTNELYKDNEKITLNLLYPEYISLNEPAYRPGITPYNEDKHIEYVIKSNFKLHIKKLQSCLIEDLKLDANKFPKEEPEISFNSVRNRGTLDYTLQVSDDKQVNLFIVYNLVNGEHEMDVRPLHASQIFLEDTDKNNCITLTPPYYYKDFLKVINEQYSTHKEVVNNIIEETLEDKYNRLKIENKGATLLFRTNNMYASYFDDAKVVQDVLGYSSFYHYNIDRCLPRLIRHGLRVAIIDEVYRNNAIDFGEKASITAYPDVAEEEVKQEDTQEIETAKAEGEKIAHDIINTKSKEDQENILKSTAVDIELTENKTRYRGYDAKALNFIKSHLIKNKVILSTLSSSLDKKEEDVKKENQTDPYIPVYENIPSKEISKTNNEYSQPITTTKKTSTTQSKNSNNYVAKFDATEFSIDQRINANFNAILLLKQLEDEPRDIITNPLTDQEQRILAAYSGWGGLAKAFNKEYLRWGDSQITIRELFDKEEDYLSARESRHTAYYTPLYINEQLWQIAKICGFKGGTILEGSAGTGGILSAMPTDIRDTSQIDAVEIDNISAKILHYLHPGANVTKNGFEKTFIKNGTVDLAITNVPFSTNFKVYDPADKDLSNRFTSLQDFCIAKNVRKLKQGGLGIFISTSKTLDNATELRRWITTEGEADFIGTYRLNVTAFQGANADVTTDVIVIKKRTSGIKSPLSIDLSTSKVVKAEEITDYTTNKTRTAIMQYNQYYIDNPQMMSGVMQFGYERGNTHFGGIPVHLYPQKADVKSESYKQIAKQEIQDTFQTFITDITNRIAESKDIDANITKEIIDTPTIKTIINNNQTNDLFADNFSVPEDTKVGALILDNNNVICQYLADPYDSNIRHLVPLKINNNNKIKGKYTKAECLKDYNILKNSLNELINYQNKNTSDEQLTTYLDKANHAYDYFYNRYGVFESRSLSWLRNDVDFYSINATQEVKEHVNKANGTTYLTAKKASIYSKRVINAPVEPKADTVQDALILSYQRFRRINLNYMSSKLNINYQDIEKELLQKRLAFEDPLTNNLVIAHEYLSGNVRDKLNIAELYNADSRYNNNIEELNKIIPMSIPIHLIEINLGCTWIPTQIYSEYIKETYQKDNIQLVNVNGKWVIPNQNKHLSDISVTDEQTGYKSPVLNKQITGLQIFMAAINNRSIKLREAKGTIIDHEGERIISNMIDDVKINFNTWVKNYLTNQNTELGAHVETTYNNNFNNYVQQEITDAFLPTYFEGQSTAIDLYSHQKKAVLRGTMQPLLLAHEVGTGKTYTLISTGMEMKRLGIAQKPMIVVQNATNTQFVAAAKELYPGARILTIDNNNKEERKTFYNKMLYNDWDLIIVPHSVLDKIPDSYERKRNYINQQINDLTETIQKSKQIGLDSKEISPLDIKLENLQSQLSDLSKLADEHYKRINNKTVALERSLDREVDDIELNFDQLGIDALLIDEAHNYKRLGFDTSIPQGVKGIDSAQSQRAVGLYLKIKSIIERSGGKNIIMATGTPISNTCAELWTFLRYLSNRSVLTENNMRLFDEFVQNYGYIRPDLEFTPTGNYKQINRLSSYTNVPELMRLWQQYTDTVLTKELDYINDKVPNLKNGQPSDVFLEPTIMTRLLNQKLAEKGQWYENLPKEKKKEYRHLPLVLYGLAKRACIDPRLIIAEENIPEDIRALYHRDGLKTKTQATIDYVLKKLEQTKDYNGTIAIFCDNYRRLEYDAVEDKKVEKFNLFKEIQNELIKEGVPSEQIFVMESGMSGDKKHNIFESVQKGKIRVILGTTALLGTGVNIQNRLCSAIHMDAPVRPMDYEQRNGRILRQGNQHKEWGIDVEIVRFGIMRTMDTTSYQVLKNKSKFVNQVMNNKEYLQDPLSQRNIEEESTEYDRPTAVLSGSQYYVLAEQAKKDYNRILSRQQQHNNNQIAFTNCVRKNEALIPQLTEQIKQNQEVIDKLASILPTGKIESVTYDDINIINKNGNILATEETTGEQLFNVESENDQIKNDKKSILYPIYNNINKQVAAETTRIRENAEIKEYNMPPLKITLNGNINVTLNYKFQRNVKLTTSEYKVEVNRTLHYDIPQLGLHNVPVSGAQVRAAIEDIVQNVLTADDAKEKIKSLQNAISRMEKENSIKKPLIGIEFKEKEELQKAKENHERFSLLANKEIEEIKANNNEALKDIPPLDIDIDALLKIYEEDSSEHQSLDFNVYRAYTQEEDTEIALELLSTMRKAGIDVQLSNEDVRSYGYTKDNKIIINTRDLNFETPIHEYSHLWCRSMQQKNPELWREIKKDIMAMHFLQHPESAQMLSSLSEEKQELAKDLATSELIARYSGRSGAIKLHNEYRRLKDNGQKGYICEKVFSNVLQSLNKFWNWTAKTIFGKIENNTFDVIADTILCEMLSGPQVINLDKKQEEKIEKSKNEINDKPLEKHIKEIISKKKHRGFKM